MRKLPAGWKEVRLDSIAEVRLGRQRSPKRATGPHMRPYLRAANVTWEGLDLSDVKEMDCTPKEMETYRLRPGDILLSEASGSAGEVGKPAVWRGEIADCGFQNTLIRVRPPEGMSAFLRYHFLKDALTGRFANESRGVGIHHLGAERMSSWPIVVPPPDEQRRIVAELEKQFSRLDDVTATLARLKPKLQRARAAVLQAAVDGTSVPADVPPDSWQQTTLGDLGKWTSGGTPSRGRPDYFGGSIPWVKSGELPDGVVTGTEETLTDAGVENSSAKVFPASTLITNRLIIVLT